MTSSAETLKTVQQKIWEGTIPLEIRLAKDDTNEGQNVQAYYLSCPRLSYLPLLLDKLYDYFISHLKDPSVQPHTGYFTFESVPLKWHFPVGLLYDLYSGANGHSLASEDDLATDSGTLPWQIVLHFSNWPTDQLPPLDQGGRVLRDAFTNSMKESTFLRTGGGKVAMSLGMQDSNALWESVVSNHLARFRPVQLKLVRPPGVTFRHIPLRIYLPAAPEEGEDPQAENEGAPAQGKLRVLQTLVTPAVNSRQPQTMGTALNTMIPSLFPSRRSPLLAQPVLHGAIVPLAVTLEELAEYAAYADGWLHVSIVMM